MFIHRLNPIGDDILRRYGSVAPMGDAEYTIDEETNLFLPSMLMDICAVSYTHLTLPTKIAV